MSEHDTHVEYEAPEPRDDQSRSDDDRNTELANAEVVHRENGNNIKFDSAAGRFRLWTGTHWAFDDDGAVVRMVKDVARRTRARLEQSGQCSKDEAKKFGVRAEAAAGVAGVLKLLQTEPGVSKNADAFDRDDFALNVANGTINLNNGGIRAHNRDDLITVCLPTAFNPNATCPLWISCIDTWMDRNPALISYLQRLAGLCATGFAGVHELPIFHGLGANGKSVFIDTLIGLMDEYASIAPETLLMARERGGADHPTEIAGLRSKRLVVASETESGGRLNESKVKRLTGDALLVGRFMRHDFFTIRRTWKLILVTNHRPRINEDSEAMRRRIRLVPWDVTIPRDQRDPELLTKLRSEWPGILRWIVDGAVAWRREGMNAPNEVLLATDDYFEEVDPLAEFIAERCIIGDESTFRVTRAALFADYTAWAKRVGETKPLDRSALYDRVRKMEGISDGAWKSQGRVTRGFAGIALCASTQGGGGES